MSLVRLHSSVGRKTSIRSSVGRATAQKKPLFDFSYNKFFLLIKSVDSAVEGYFTVNDVVVGSNPTLSVRGEVAQLVERDKFPLAIFLPRFLKSLEDWYYCL